MINYAKYSTMLTLNRYLKIAKFCHWLPLIQFFKLQFMHNLVNNDLPQSFDTTWIRNMDRRTHEDQAVLRNQQEFFLPPIQTHFYRFIPLR